jgi:hypothetical protein
MNACGTSYGKTYGLHRYHEDHEGGTKNTKKSVEKFGCIVLVDGGEVHRHAGTSYPPKIFPTSFSLGFLRVLRVPFVIFVTTIYAGENFRRSKLFFRLRPLSLALEPRAE